MNTLEDKPFVRLIWGYARALQLLGYMPDDENNRIHNFHLTAEIMYPNERRVPKRFVQRISLHDAELLILEKLIKGEIRSYGIIRNQFSKVPLDYWEMDRIKWDAGEIHFHRLPIVTGIQVSLQDIEACFKNFSPKKSTIKTETECEKWLIAEMQKSPDGNPFNKSHWKDQAISRFGVSVRGFNRIWDNSLDSADVKKTWGKPGRKKKS